MKRLYYFDNIKIVLILFVIFQHSGMAYVPVAEGWSPSFPGPFPFADVVVINTFLAVSASFAMALFFFISAYFLPGSFDRKGRQKFLRDRSVRIGIPLFGIVAFLLILMAAVGANPATLNIGWLWFLVFLLILAVAYSFWRMFNVTIRPLSCPGNGTLVLAALALGAANFVVRGWYGEDQWVLWHAVEPAHVPLYVLFMIGGILAYRNGWLDDVSPSLVRTWSIITVIALCGIPVGIAALGVAPFGGGFTALTLLSSFWEAFLSIGICTCMLIVFKHRWNVTGRIKTTLAKNVYTVYLIQIPIILFWQSRFIQGGVLIPGGLPPLMQFVLVGVLATIFCFLISNYIVRKIPYAERVVF
jgi:peptidoglycan/LPS O-acetylase OafA/YrhL